MHFVGTFSNIVHKPVCTPWNHSVVFILNMFNFIVNLSMKFDIEPVLVARGEDRAVSDIYLSCCGLINGAAVYFC